MNQAKIILLCVFAAITYGVLHDQITARLCIEYFTVAHPPLFSATSPTMVGLCWGVAATFGIGLILGTLLALVGHSGSEPPLRASELFKPIFRLLVTMAITASIAGVSGYLLARGGIVAMPDELAAVIPQARHFEFMAVWFAHGASYLVGLIGGSRLVFRIWRRRGRASVLPIYPKSPGAVIRAAVVGLVAAYILWMRLPIRWGDLVSSVDLENLKTSENRIPAKLRRLR